MAIKQNVSSFNLKINGLYEISDPASGQLLYRGKDLRSTVAAYKSGITIGGRFFAAEELLVCSRESAEVVLNNRIYRGALQLIRKGQDLLIVNHIAVEDYVKGILYHEVSHYWPQEALKAQAVVSRTFAFYQMQENSSRQYDVTCDIYSQVYGGQISERYRTSRAVDQTKDEVITYKDKIIPAYFHAVCGGHTEDASLLWKTDLLPLKGVRCDFCKNSPHFRWHTVLSFDEIDRRLIQSGYSIQGIKDIVVLDKDGSGRVQNIELKSDKVNMRICAKDFRALVGPDIIRSTNFQVEIAQRDALFAGFGWGHGVGLCQWGAYFMAKQGFNYAQILQHYYPQTQTRHNSF